MRNGFFWKPSVGPVHERPGHWNGMWQYWSTDGAICLTDSITFLCKCFIVISSSYLQHSIGLCPLQMSLASVEHGIGLLSSHLSLSTC